MFGNCSVKCLYSLKDLKTLAKAKGLKLSGECQKELMICALKQVGASVAEKHLKNLVKNGQLKWGENNFEVESILDHAEKDGKEFYHIKWRGWSHIHNTWEPREHLQCEALLEEYHNGLEHGQHKKEPPSKEKRLLEFAEELTNIGITVEALLALTPTTSTTKPELHREAKTVTLSLLNRKSKPYKDRKALQVQQLKAWEKEINTNLIDPAPILVENHVDLEGPPTGFKYINDYLPMDGITICQDPVIGCACSPSCLENKKKCCGPSAGGQFAYYKNKRVRVPKGNPIYECNKRCLCSTDCPNRVVQLGRKHKVCIFRTSNGRGWGVKAMQRIPRGTFVMEYVGEVITFEEAEKRGKTYDLEGMTYLFDLDYDESSAEDCPFTVDARIYGNVAHFVNHSCDPNLEVFGVWINTLDVRLPRIALFACKDIPSGEELTFDYLMTGATEVAPTDTADLENKMSDLENKSSDLENKSSDLENKSSDHENKTSDLENKSSDHENKASDLENKTNNHENKTTEPGNKSSDLEKPANLDRSLNVERNSPEPMVTTPPPSPVKQGLGLQGFSRNRKQLLPPASQYRLRCQCGAKNCRGFLY